ncbi:MAG TPA: imidazoleglycerol-phosphate dehydratase HisB [Micromonosporaceae bacterium]|jgi:imidazoleglycerol-phosphate dehydratase
MARSRSADGERRAVVERDTAESKVRVELTVDGSGRTDVATGIGFYDHMLSQLGRHGGFDLTVRSSGDLDVDAHHTVEDTALALGAALGQALGDKTGIRRFGSVHVPLDEVLVQAAVDLSGRGYVVYEEPPGLAPYVGGTGPLFPTSLARHFWESFGYAARLTLHVVVVRAARPGSQPDAHHVLEGQFKAVARALRDAVRVEDPAGGVPSTKGVL